MKEILLYFTLKYKGNWEAIYEALANKEKVGMEELKKYIKKNKNNYISIIDNNFPEGLKLIYEPPFSIFWKGDDKLLEKKMITLLGKEIESSRNFEFLLNKTKEDYVYVLNYSQENIINTLISQKCKVIVFADQGLQAIEKDLLYKSIIQNKNLIMTEISLKEKNEYHEQYLQRLQIGLSRNVINLNKYEKKDHIAISICKLEDIQMKTMSEHFNSIESIERELDHTQKLKMS